MGNSLSAAGEPPEEEEEVPPVRATQQTTCCVCFEEGNKGLLCEQNHLLCEECVTPYCVSIFTDIGQLKDASFCVHCPAIDTIEGEGALVRCSAGAYHSRTLRSFLKEEALDLYLDSLIQVCHQREGQRDTQTQRAGENEREDSNTRQRLLECLNLKCPNPQCNVVLDPTPDGCASIRCAGRVYGSMMYGIWYMVYGICYMIYGIWYMVYGRVLVYL
jgi:hypothetical protein